MMNQWWNNEVRPAMKGVKEDRAGAREALVLDARRAELEGESAAPAAPPTRSLSEVGSGGDAAEAGFDSKVEAVPEMEAEEVGFVSAASAVGPAFGVGVASSSSAGPADPTADLELRVEGQLSARDSKSKPFEFGQVSPGDAYYNCFDGWLCLDEQELGRCV